MAEAKYLNPNTTLNKLMNELSQYPVLTTEEERNLFQIIDKGKSLPIYTTININDKANTIKEESNTAKLMKPCMNFEMVFSTLANEKDAVSIMKNLYSSFSTRLNNNNKIYQYYLATYMEAMLKKERALTYEELTELYNHTYKEYNYFKEFNVSKVTTNLEEQLKAYKEYMEAREKMINSNIKLVVSIAKSFNYHKKDNMQDLIPEGIEGLEIAIDRFETNRGGKFSTYATWWVKQKMYRYTQEDSLIRKPVHVVEQLLALAKESKELEQKYGYTLSSEEQAKETKLSFLTELNIKRRIAKIDSLHEINTITDPTSLNQSLLDEDDKDTFLIDHLSVNPTEVQDAIDEDNLRNDLTDALNCLTSREQIIIKRRFGIDQPRPETLEEIGSSMGITRERVRQIEAKAIRILRDKTEKGKNKLKAYKKN